MIDASSQDRPNPCLITSPLQNRKLEHVAHGQPVDAFPAFGIVARYNALRFAAIKVEVLIACFDVTGSKPQEIKQEVVDGMGGSDGV